MREPTADDRGAWRQPTAADLRTLAKHVRETEQAEREEWQRAYWSKNGIP